MEFSLFRSWSSRQFAIDLGTANTLIYTPGEGIVVDEPSVVAVELVNGVQKVRAVGEDAKTLIGKTGDNIRTHRPLSDGVIKDLELAEQMVRHFIEKAARPRKGARSSVMSAAATSPPAACARSSSPPTKWPKPCRTWCSRSSTSLPARLARPVRKSPPTSSTTVSC